MGNGSAARRARSAADLGADLDAYRLLAQVALAEVARLSRHELKPAMRVSQ